ncbi:hypothetical protein MJO28_014632 [Puccinia striiformis f. sp. tritici]|uniref:Uncharacterized protein n=1 Tax=Puccinia striiformis f. sp. tritici TaxID=168172 RepID=A0ACC0DVW2_9BASI|nr:hypothetical protein MJO28_014632 [Puccinia striiformis f. sp. tritici]
MSSPPSPPTNRLFKPLLPVPRNFPSIHPHQITAATTLEALPTRLLERFHLETSDLALVTDLINTPLEHRWALTALMLVRGHPRGPHDSIPHAHTPEVSLDRGEQFFFSAQLQDFIKSSLRATLLRGDIEYYSRACYAGPARLSCTPMTVVKAHLRQQFRSGLIPSTALPHGYGRWKPSALGRMSHLIGDRLEVEKFRFQAIIMLNILPFSEGSGRIPTLEILMDNLWRELLPEHANCYEPLIPEEPTDQDHYRIAHMRLHFLDGQFNPPVPSEPLWITFDREIQVISRQSVAYREAHAEAIRQRDADLFNGWNDLEAIAVQDRRLPNQHEIEAQMPHAPMPSSPTTNGGPPPGNNIPMDSEPGHDAAEPTMQ